jgi:hypothetical protein
VDVRCADSSGKVSVGVQVAVFSLVTPVVAGINGTAFARNDRVMIVTSTSRAVELNAPADGSGAFAANVTAKLQRVDLTGDKEHLDPSFELPLTISDGSLQSSVTVTLPLFEIACGKNGTICDFRIAIENPSVIDDVTAGGSFICPMIPSRSGAADARCAGGTLAQVGDKGTFFTVRYVAQCHGDYLPVHECSNLETAERSAGRCAFGVGDTCKPCPTGGICPGGNVIWSLPKYYVSSSDPYGLVVEQCPAPADARCPGWDYELQQTKCGKHLAGVRCTSCVKGYYADSKSANGFCSECPSNNYSSLLAQGGIFCAFLLCVFLAMFGAIWAIERRSGNARPWMIAVRQSKEFCIWACLSAQIMATASASSAPGIPAFLNSLYTYLSFFNLDTGSSVHAECLSSLFTTAWATLGAIITLLALNAGLWGAHKLSQVQVHCGKMLRALQNTLKVSTAGLQGSLFIFMSAMYPLVTKHVLKLLHCKTDPTLGLVLASAPIIQKGVLNETSGATDYINMQVQCWTTEGVGGVEGHLTIGVFAVTVKHSLHIKRFFSPLKASLCRCLCLCSLWWGTLWRRSCMCIASSVSTTRRSTESSGGIIS